MLTGYYDQRCCPSTFDVVTFLLRLEQDRLRRGEESVEIEILPGPNGGFRQDDLWPHSIDERREMRARVVVPMCTMLPSCKRVVVHDARVEKKPDSFGFGEYTMSFKYFVEVVGSGIRPLRPLATCVWGARNPKLISMTLRESEHWTPRNSKTSEWLRAAVNLQMMGFEVVVVRDTRLADEPFGKGIATAPHASVDLFERAALYEAAACNMFISNGPAWFAIALDAPVVMLRPATDNAGPCSSEAALASIGLPRGSQFPNAAPHQRLVWQDDTAENIIESCCRFMEDRGAERSAA